MDFDFGIQRTMQQRVAMVTHSDCTHETLRVVAEFDTEDPVILACAFGKNADNVIEDIVMTRLKLTDRKSVV